MDLCLSLQRHCLKPWTCLDKQGAHRSLLALAQVPFGPLSFRDLVEHGCPVQPLENSLWIPGTMERSFASLQENERNSLLWVFSHVTSSGWLPLTCRKKKSLRGALGGCGNMWDNKVQRGTACLGSHLREGRYHRVSEDSRAQREPWWCPLPAVPSQALGQGPILSKN